MAAATAERTAEGGERSEAELSAACQKGQRSDGRAWCGSDGVRI